MKKTKISIDQTLQDAVACHRNRQWPEAERLYRAILQKLPHHGDANHNLGVLAVEQGKPDAGLPFLKTALEADPAAEHYWLSYIAALLAAKQPQNARLVLDHGRQRGLAGPAVEALSQRLNRESPGPTQARVGPLFATAAAHHQAGRLDAAEALYRDIVAIDKRHAESLHRLGIIAGQTGRPDLAIHWITQALAVDDGRAAYHASFGLALQAQGRVPEAIAAFETALRLQADSPEVLFFLATALAMSGRIDDAVDRFEQALRIRPSFPEAAHSLALALRDLGDWDRAAAQFERALALAPASAEVAYNFGLFLQEQGRLEDARARYEQALGLRPDFPDARNNLGLTFELLERLDEAAVAFEQVLKARPDAANIHCNLGNVRKAQGRLDAAMACYARAVEIDPQCGEAIFNQSLIHLRRGEFALGWPAYEARWRGAVKGVAARPFPQSLWSGEDLSGRAILLHAEQGLGDTLMFCRYAPLLAQAGATVVLEVQAPLRRLLGTIPGVAAVIAPGDPLPDFALQCPLASLPAILGTTFDTLPPPPTLAIDAKQVTRWRKRLPKKAGFRIGVAWAGSPTQRDDFRRSLPLARIFAHRARAGTSWHSVQKDLRQGDAELLAETGTLVHHGADLQDFSDTAALMAALDLVITVDTAVAHLAGTLGVPTWTMLRYDPDWRWFDGRDDSPWYPGMRLFRQPAPGRWDAVIDHIGAELSAMGYV